MSIHTVPIVSSGSLQHHHRAGVLSNGMPLVVVCLPHLHSASISVYFKAGSRYESPELNGISHFLEHMMFRGTRKYPSTYALNLAVERLGGTLFAATSPTSTEFEIGLPRDTHEDGIRLMADILTEPIFDDMEIERRIIAEEALEDYDEKGRPVDIDFLSRSRLWPGHALGQSVIGPIHNINRFSIGNIREHFANHYVAANGIVCLSGAFDPDRAPAIAEEVFSALPAKGPAILSAPPTLGRGPSTANAFKPGSQTQVRVAFHTPGDDDPDHTALSILLGVLDDGMSTRLHRRIFDERGLAYHISAGMDSYPDVSVLNIDATCSHENVRKVVDEILILAVEMSEHPISGEELDKAKKRAAWDIEAFLDDPQAMSLWYGEQALFRKPPFLEERVRELSEVTPEDLMRIAGRVFRPQNLHVTTVGVLEGRDEISLDRCISRFT